MGEFRDEYTSKLKKVTTPGIQDNVPASKKTNAGGNDVKPGAPVGIFPDPAPVVPRGQKPPAGTEKREGRRKKKKKKKRSGKGRLVFFIGFFSLIILLIVLAVAGPHLSSKVKTGFVQTGSLEKSADGRAVFLRDERTVAAETSGKVVAKINEGERVAKGDVVAYVADGQMEEIVGDLKTIEDRIAAAQTYSDSILESVSSSLSEISNAVSSEILSLTPQIAHGSLRDFSERRNNVETYFELQNDMTMNVQTKDAYISSLQSKRAELIDRLDGHMHSLTAPESGVVSYCLDGQEKTVSSMDPENVTAASLAAFQENAAKTVGTAVEKGTNVFRVTSGNDYYMAVTIGKDASQIKRNAPVTVQADNHSFKAEASVVSVTDAGSGESLVLLKSASNLSTTVSYRVQEVNVIFEAVTGLKVPVKSLSDWDSAGLTAKLSLIRSNYVECIYVNVESYNDEYAIVSNQTAFDDESDRKGVQANDMYVLNPASVTEGELIG